MKAWSLIGLSKPLGWIRSARSEREQRDSFDNRGTIRGFFHRRTLPGRVRYRSHLARWWQIGWDALEIGPEKETAENKSRWSIQSQYRYHASRCCAAIRRRSRCGPVRGWPVLSWHFSPGAAPHVGQATASIFCAVSSFFMAEEEYFKPSGRVCTLAHPFKGPGKAIFRIGRERGCADQIGTIEC
jgi:hypothetical protein